MLKGTKNKFLIKSFCMRCIYLSVWSYIFNTRHSCLVYPA